MQPPLKKLEDNRLSFTLDNGSRVVSLPSKEENVRGYAGVSLLLIDEASRVPNALYYALRPMLAVSRGRLILMSTPSGRRGFFWKAWKAASGWAKVEIKAGDVPRITKQFLEEEQAQMGPRWFRQEYQCSFEDVEGAVFSQEFLDALVTAGVQPFGEPVLTPTVDPISGILPLVVD